MTGLQTSTILLVEDNPDDAELTIRALRRSNVANQIVTAGDGAAALDYLFGTGEHAGRDTSQQPQLILLDLMLPKLNGMEVLARLRADLRTKLLPVVVLTSSDEERDRFATYSLGANSFVRKPVDFEQFSQAVQQLGLYWLVLNAPPPRTD